MAAIYHLSARLAGRSTGRSAIAMVCYRCAIAAVDPDTGIEHDYTLRRDVGEYRTVFPDNAPDELAGIADEAERAVALWTAVEEVESSARAVFACEVNVALDRDLPVDDQLACLAEAAEWLREQGMAVTWAYHADDDNPHGHLMLTRRGWTEDGEWEPKRAPKEYLCRDRGGQERYMAGPEFREAREEGWEKVYRYPGGRYTDSEWREMHPDGSIHDRLSKDAVQAPARAMHEWQEWDNRAQAAQRGYYIQAVWLGKLREQWEEISNRTYERLGMDREVCCLSYAEQGVDRIATIHEGWQAREIDEGGEVSFRVAYNIIAREHNAEIEHAEANPIADEELQRQAIDALLEHGRACCEATADLKASPEALQEHMERSVAWLEDFRERFDRLREQVREIVERAREAARRLMELTREPVRRVLDAFDARREAHEELARLAREAQQVRSAEMPAGYSTPGAFDAAVVRAEAELAERERNVAGMGRYIADLEERIKLKQHLPMFKTEVANVRDSISAESGHLAREEKALAQAQERLGKLQEAAPQVEQVRAKMAALDLERAETMATRDACGERAVDLYDRLDDGQRREADGALAARGDSFHEQLLDARGRDFYEEEIRRTMPEGYERCEALLARLNERVGDAVRLGPQLDRLGRDLSRLTDEERERFMDKHPKVLHLTWGDLKDARGDMQNTRGLSLSKVVERAHTMQYPDRDYTYRRDMGRGSSINHADQQQERDNKQEA